MALILSHRTACEYWLSGMQATDFVKRNYVDGGGIVHCRGSAPFKLLSSMSMRRCASPPVSLRRNGRVDGKPPCANEVRRVIEALSGEIECPLHVMSFSRRLWSISDAVVHFFSAGIPGSSFYRLEGVCGLDAYVASPELAFLQSASQMDWCSLVRLGYSLCSQYRIDRLGNLARSIPLTDVGSLTRYVNAVSGFPGRRRAKEALKVVANGAASPRESALTQLLSAPLNRGGYALPLPVLSYQIETKVTMRQCSSKSFYVADLCWPDSKLVVEYDSEEWHCNPTKMAEDARKRADLSYMGYEVFTVTNSQMRSLRDMDLLASLLRKRLGRSAYQPSSYNYPERKRELRRRLLSGLG